jgi:hypothetical protein
VSKKKKLTERLLQRPKDFTWDGLKTLLGYLGFEEQNKGQTAGSRRCFQDKEGTPIWFHEPHPSKILKMYMVKQLIDLLNKEELL